MILNFIKNNPIKLKQNNKNILALNVRETINVCHLKKKSNRIVNNTVLILQENFKIRVTLKKVF